MEGGLQRWFGCPIRPTPTAVNPFVFLGNPPARFLAQSDAVERFMDTVVTHAGIMNSHPHS